MKNKEHRIHPTQKPIALYAWIFHNYAKPGMKILDTHLGSESSRIAAHKAGLDFTGYELDKEYFVAQEKRFSQYRSQLTMKFE
jgi:site-specific DNA-methyltransferase (adenine-specific)